MLVINIFALSFFGIAFALIGYFNFLEKVKKISKSNLTPDQMYAELNKAAAGAVTFSLGGFAVGKLGPIGTIWKWYLRGFSYLFGLVWYDDVWFQ